MNNRIVLTVDGKTVYDSSTPPVKTNTDGKDENGVDITKYKLVTRPKENETYHFLNENKELEPGIYTTSYLYIQRGQGPIYDYYKNSTFFSHQPPILYTEISSGGAKRRTKRRRTKNRKSKRRYHKKK